MKGFLWSCETLYTLLETNVKMFCRIKLKELSGHLSCRINRWTFRLKNHLDKKKYCCYDYDAEV